MNADLVLTELKAYIKGRILECCLAIKDGEIVKVGKEASMPQAYEKLSLNNLLVLPGLIDVHVHLRDEGKAYKEDFYSGTSAAAAGGITTVLDMPNNDPVTMSLETLRNRIKSARDRILVNVGFYCEFPENIREIGKLVREGVLAFKLFLNEQMGGLNINDDMAIMEAFKMVAPMIPIAVHSEDNKLLRETEETLRRRGFNDVEAFLKVHSKEAEAKALRRVLDIVKKTGKSVHICHISTEESLEAIDREKEVKMPVTCEVTPHHLLLSIEDLKKFGTLGLTAPPLREKAQTEAFWRGLKMGLIDVVSSDHAPHTVEEKIKSVVWEVNVGIPGLETTLPLLLTEMNRKRLSIAEIVKLMAENPAKIFGLNGRGSIEEGNKADLVVIDPKREDEIDSSKFYSKAKYSPFDGRRVKGKPLKTFVCGKLVMDEGNIVAEAGSGEIIRRKMDY
ncbi:MAG: dihydroorotase family protein [Candidatus Bathyarchaeia archaeon]